MPLLIKILYLYLAYRNQEKKMNIAIIKPRWSFLTIALMVIGFILWAPLGLAMLAYIIWGEYFGGSSEKVEIFIDEAKKRIKKHKSDFRSSYGSYDSSGNAAFDEYRKEQLRRLDEERRRLDEEVREFREYMHNLRRARDREEFDQYMRSRKKRHHDYDVKTDEDRDKNI